MVKPMNLNKRSNVTLAAHKYWETLVKENDLVIDATAGNGHDTLFLANLCRKGTVYAIDIQEQALQNTLLLLKQASLEQHVKLYCQSHAAFPDEVIPGSIKLITYNLGYLPGSDKSLTTQAETTLQSMQAALKLLMPGGAISAVCYNGHPAGKVEEAAVLEFARHLDPQIWSCYHTTWLNRNNCPSLLLIHLKQMATGM